MSRDLLCHCIKISKDMPKNNFCFFSGISRKDVSSESEEGRNTRNIWLIDCLVCSTQTEALETYDKGEGVIMSNFQFFLKWVQNYISFHMM